MYRSIISFAVKEVVLIALMLVSLAPAYLLGVVADTASLQLFALDEKLDLPVLSSFVAESIAGYHSQPETIAIAFWLLTAILFMSVAVTSETSQEFRLRFLPGFLLVWSVYLGFVALILAAWAIPNMPLIERIDNTLLSNGAGVIVTIELVIFLGLSIFFWIRANRRRAVRGRDD